MTVPLCFDSKHQYQQWRNAARVCEAGLKKSGYCTDCTPEYKAKMMKEGRCQYPKTWFGADEDGFVVGVREV